MADILGTVEDGATTVRSEVDMAAPVQPPGIREVDVSDDVDALVRSLLEWIGPRSRPYSEVIEAWRTSCPRLPVWEEANQRGFVTRHREPRHDARVSVTAAGREFLARTVRAGT